MAFALGDWVWAEFTGKEVPAIVVEIVNDELVVQQEGTRRRDAIPSSRCRPR